MSPRIVAFGELLWDLLPSGAQLGGAPANFALRAQGVGCKVSLVTRIGNDAYGKEALATLKTLGLDTSCVQIDERLPTGTVDVQLSEQGNASYHIVKNVAYDHIALVPELEELSSTVDLICFGTLSQRALVSRSTLYSFIEMCPRAIKLVDINLRKECYSPETVRRSGGAPLALPRSGLPRIQY